MKRGIHPSPKWNARFKTIHNARHVAPKYKQLIYWITTDSLLDGRRILRSSPKGICPECGQIASRAHMFRDCPLVKHIWNIASQLGARHWDDYSDFQYGYIPTILADESPIKIFHICFLWALWIHWLQQFIGEPLPDRQTQINNIIETARKEFFKRIYELNSTVQWINLNKLRKKNDSGNPVPEKLFLLRYAKSVRTNPGALTLAPQEKLDPIITSWIGKRHLLDLDHSFHRPRLRVIYRPWSELLPPQVAGPHPDPASGWSVGVPRHVVA